MYACHLILRLTSGSLEILHCDVASHSSSRKHWSAKCTRMIMLSPTIHNVRPAVTNSTGTAIWHAAVMAINKFLFLFDMNVTERRNHKPHDSKGS